MDAAVTISNTGSTLGDGPNGGSEFTLGMTEDLGNGLSAIGAFTIIGSHVDNAGFSTYNSFVGLSGAEFGSLKFGSQWSPVFLASTISDATGRWGSTSVTTPQELQNSGSVTYTSPSIAGFTLSYQKQLLGANTAAGSGQLNSTGSGDASAYSINYANGGLSVAYAKSSDNVYGNTTFIAGSYDFGIAKLHVGSVTTTGTGANSVVTPESSANSVGISAPIGNTVISGMWGSAEDGTTASNYAVMYNMSKRTAIYANSGTSAGTTTNIIGIKHAF